MYSKEKDDIFEENISEKRKERHKERDIICSDLFLIEMFTSDVFQQAIRMATAVFFKRSLCYHNIGDEMEAVERLSKIGKKNGEQR